MTVRLRLPELMREKGFPTANALADASGGRLSRRTLYRLLAADGRVDQFDRRVIEGLMATLGVPLSELLVDEPEPKRGRKRAKAGT